MIEPKTSLFDVSFGQHYSSKKKKNQQSKENNCDHYVWLINNFIFNCYVRIS